MSKAVIMSPTGRVTIPLAAREMLHAQEGAEFDWEVKDGSLVLRPVVRVPREDAWAYTPDHLAALEQSLRDVRKGRVRDASERELDALMQHDDANQEATGP